MPPEHPDPATPFSEDYYEDSPQIPLLLIDDDPEFRQTLARILTSAGYRVTCAEDGLEGLEQAQRQPFDVVVTAIQIPRLDGVELVEALAERDPYIECILLASVSDLERIILAAEVGNVYNHYWKPLDNLGDLLRGIARALERREMRLSNARLLTELRDTREELRGLCSRLEQLDKVAALGHMTTAVAHDLERPLTSLLGYAQYLRTRLERAEGEPLTAAQVDRVLEYMREMERGIHRCRETVEGIRDYTRVHEEPPGPVDVYEALDEALALVRHTLEAQGIGLCLNLMSSPPPVLANPRRLQQVLLSVLLNAQQAIGKSGGTITVTTRAITDEQGREAGLRVQIADTGPGIAPGVLPHIFDPFFTTRPQSESLGLGLTIARNILRAWRGEVRVESAPEQGTVVILNLPLCVDMVVPLNGDAMEWPEARGGDSGAQWAA